MNDRAQGGSSLKDGRVELMQNRRLYTDDHKGVDQALNELNEYYNGITVSASYWLEICNYGNEHCKQREQQIRNDEPLQYFYNMNGGTTAKPAKNMGTFDMNQFVLSGNTEVQTLKYQMTPMGKFKILVRLENLSDKFDTETYNPVPTDQETTYMVDMNKMAKYIWDFANGQEDFPFSAINIEETSLTANQAVSEMQKNKNKFKGLDDKKIKVPTHAPDQPGKIVSVYQMAIRTFVIEYVPFVGDFRQQGEITTKFLN